MKGLTVKSLIICEGGRTNSTAKKEHRVDQIIDWDDKGNVWVRSKVLLRIVIINRVSSLTKVFKRQLMIVVSERISLQQLIRPNWQNNLT